MDASYRKRLTELKCIYRYNCPVILLTATLPVRLEAWFRQAMLVGDAEIIRARSDKKNISYNVVQVTGPGRSAVEDEVVKQVIRITGRMTGKQKGVIYSRSKANCTRLAELIRCGYHHSDMSLSERQAVLEDWVEGRSETRWVVATTGLGTGVDIEGIVAIIHAEQPYGLVDFIQQTGRGGRKAGEEVESIVVLGRAAVYYDRQASDVDQLNRQAAERFVQTPDCRRLVLGAFMDGIAQDCDSLQAVRCDRCRQLTEVQADGRDEVVGMGECSEGGTTGDWHSAVAEVVDDRLRGDNKERQRRIRKLLEWVELMDSKCAVCYVKWCHQGRADGRQRTYEHEFRSCKVLGGSEAYMAWRRQIRFKEYTCCWTCGLPQAWYLVSHTFELAGTRPNWTIRESTNTTHPSEGPSVVGSVDIATISSNAQQEDALLSILRAMNVNPEWDQRNWFDDVLRRLGETWPTEFADDMIAPFLDYTVRLLVDAPLDWAKESTVNDESAATCSLPSNWH
ncbi:P-loop containing nucleoside triphosphate hydrolase protein [Microdochium trichocladiopsis]|uniref:DNA 3'-5' helicase n=1 Tax=Microdochium trichocladiopsis TaxID=1682393 RepID=A0A9P8XRV1_9PEZI|nr:P-loop containing nucleoside triphosphate hydrolase protein [Microdochium trichocladiopsis]KAH7012767.1 P-loop containing nucleoside triphosphate hydrolase protein [Microdochium trichocladiopsis]